jgi:hypothetical protein
MDETDAFTRDARCPGCGLSWWLSPPARIKGGFGRLTNDARCVECKRVYEGMYLTPTSAECGK